MLTLTRKPGERIIIDGGITLVVVKIKPNSIQLGIEAPADLRIARGEVVDGWHLEPQTEPRELRASAG